MGVSFKKTKHGNLHSILAAAASKVVDHFAHISLQKKDFIITNTHTDLFMHTFIKVFYTYTLIYRVI